jgi:phosphotransferase system HPr (HPr) family protein
MQIDFTFPLKAGLHARPAARLQEETQRFLSSVTFLNRTNGASVNAKSTLALVSTLTRLGDACSLVVEGKDQARACVALKDFVAQVLLHLFRVSCAVPLRSGGSRSRRALPRESRVSSM